MKFPGMSPVRARVMTACTAKGPSSATPATETRHPIRPPRIGACLSFISNPRAPTSERRESFYASRRRAHGDRDRAGDLRLASALGHHGDRAGRGPDLGETVFFWRWSRRRKARVGIETLVGRAAVAVSRVDPGGRVKLDGELWGARSETTIETGAAVVVRDVEGLTLVVEPDPERARGA